MNSEEEVTPHEYPLPGSTPWVRRLTREECARAIGRICMDFQELEESVGGHIAGLISHDLQLGPIVTAELSFRTKIGLLCSLYLYRAKLSEPPEALKSLLARLHNAEQRRNTMLHSYWGRPPGNCEALTRFKYTAKSAKGFVHHIEELYPEDIAAIATEISSVTGDLYVHMTDTFPNLNDRTRMA